MDYKTARLLEWEGNLPETGQYLQTKAGSTYAIIAVKPNTRPQPKSVAKLGLLKLTPDDIKQIPNDAIIHQFFWTNKHTKQP